MNSTIKFPFYAKFALISIGSFAFGYTMYIGQHIIQPLVYATILAILLNPLVNFLVRKKCNKILAIFIAVIITILIVLVLLYFISVQLAILSETFPALKAKMYETSKQAIQWTADHFNINAAIINNWIQDTEKDAVNNLGSAISQTISAISNILIILVLLPVYLVMILYYKDLLLEFIRKLFKEEQHTAIFEILTNSKRIIQSYLIGLLLEAAIVATLNSLGLLFIGIEYAIILGITGAILNVIPYIGGVIAIALPMIIAFVTKDDASYAFLVLIIYLIIQFIDNHFIIPSIVASKVKINALISVIVVLLGGAMWGIPGMFLSIPLTAILKVIFDHIESLKPWGFLLGNVVPTSKPAYEYIKRKASIKMKKAN